MRQFIDLLVANFKMTIRNKQALFWLFLFPLIMMSLFGIVFGGGESKPKLGLVDLDNSKLSREIGDGFKKAKVVKVSKMNSVAAARAKLKAGNLDGVVVLRDGFSADLGRAIKANETRRMSAITARLGQSAAYPGQQSPGGAVPAPTGAPALKPPAKTAPLTPAKVDLYYDPSATFASQVARGVVANVLGYVDRAVGQAPTLISLESHSVRQKNLRYIDFLVPGIIAMTLMNSAMFGLAGTIVTYRERGILRRLKVTPQPLTTFLAAQITNQLTFSILRVVLLIAVARALFNVHVIGSYLSLLVVVIIGSLAFVTIAFAIASFSKNREISDTVSNIISMPMMFLGGVFFPVDGAPAWIRPLINALPLKYLGDAMRGVMIKGDSLKAISTDLWVLVGVTFIFFLISMKLWRWE